LFPLGKSGHLGFFHFPVAERWLKGSFAFPSTSWLASYKFAYLDYRLNMQDCQAIFSKFAKFLLIILEKRQIIKT
jgi:hypothetical protein